MTGQSCEAAMGLEVTALRASLIIGLATSMAEGSSKLYWTLTKSLFSKWLLYGLGMVFSLSVLSFTVSLATKVIGAVAVAFLAKYAFPGNSGEGISSMALQQGGLGLVMTTLIVTAPPMAAAFFQGTLGQFTAYSALGQLDRANQEPGAGRPYQPAEPAPRSETRTATTEQLGGRVAGTSQQENPQSDGRRGQANA